MLSTLLMVLFNSLRGACSENIDESINPDLLISVLQSLSLENTNLPTDIFHNHIAFNTIFSFLSEPAILFVSRINHDIRLQKIYHPKRSELPDLFELGVRWVLFDKINERVLDVPHIKKVVNVFTTINSFAFLKRDRTLWINNALKYYNVEEVYCNSIDIVVLIDQNVIVYNSLPLQRWVPPPFEELSNGIQKVCYNDFAFAVLKDSWSVYSWGHPDLGGCNPYVLRSDFKDLIARINGFEAIGEGYYAEWGDLGNSFLSNAWDSIREYLRKVNRGEPDVISEII